MTDDEFITESELGTKQYWEQFYDEELNNFKDHGDSGETWFGIRNANKIIDWIEKNVPDKKSSICDIGCGNGYVLAKLASKKFQNLYGLDYSEKAIEFCNIQHRNNQIQFKVVDILEDNDLFYEKFDVIIDKGTYDAICLMPNVDINVNRRKYVKFLTDNLICNGHFIIITCNFTKDEILKLLSNDSRFEMIYEFDTPVLSFGGQIGKQVTGLVFGYK